MGKIANSEWIINVTSDSNQWKSWSFPFKSIYICFWNAIWRLFTTNCRVKSNGLNLCPLAGRFIEKFDTAESVSFRMCDYSCTYSHAHVKTCDYNINIQPNVVSICVWKHNQFMQFEHIITRNMIDRRKLQRNLQRNFGKPAHIDLIAYVCHPDIKSTFFFWKFKPSLAR